MVTPAQPDSPSTPFAVCLEGGLLVAGDDWLPEDRRDYHAGGLGLFVGCNHLRCRACGHAVRTSLGFARVPATPPATLAGLSDWTTLPEYIAGASTRLYACACVARVVANMTPLEVPDYALDFEDALPWRCGGHSPVVRPGNFAGVTLDAQPRWSNLAATLLAKTGDPALHPRVDTFAGFGAQRVYLALEPASDRDALSRAIAAEAIANPAHLAAGVLFFALRPLADGFELLASHAAAHLDAFRGVPAGWGPEPTLERYLFNTMTVRLTVTPTGPAADVVRAALRSIATTAPGLGPWLDWYARIDRDWAQDHLAALVGASPEGWQKLFGVVRPDRAGPLTDAGAALVALGHARREDVLASVAELGDFALTAEVERRWPADPT